MLRNTLSRTKVHWTAKLTRSFSTIATEINLAAISKSCDIDSNRALQLEKLLSLKASEFSTPQLNQLITDFLLQPITPDTEIARKLLEKFLFKFPEIDENGEISTLCLIQLVQNAELTASVQFLKLLLKNPDFMNKINSRLIFDCVWKGLTDSKNDTSAFELLKEMCENHSQRFAESYLTREFKDQLIIDIFLPRLNWEAIDYLAKESVGPNNQIIINPIVLEEILISVLHPDPWDPYYEPVGVNPFSSNNLNPRFHRLIELLERWKAGGIPIKGKNISSAFEEVFKRFLPSKFMMESLQKIL